MCFTTGLSCDPPTKFITVSPRSARLDPDEPETAARASARADLVVFIDGRVVKAESVQEKGGQVDIRLPCGGGYSVDRSRVEKIIHDEVEGATEAAETAPASVQPPRAHDSAPRTNSPANVPMASPASTASQAESEAPKKTPKWSLRRGRHRL
jgi:hypothetical protein